MEIKINLHVSADASVTAVLMAFASAMAGQAVTAAPMKAVQPPVFNPEPVNAPAQAQQPTAQQPEPANAPLQAQQPEVTPDDVFGMSEAELSKCPSGLLFDAIRERTDINPDELPGKNTNAKLRRIILDYVEPQEETQEETPEETQEEPLGEGPTLEEFRALMVSRIQSKNPTVKPAAIKAIKDSGYPSLSELFAQGSAGEIAAAYQAVLNIKP
jgi:hypothetical protein